MKRGRVRFLPEAPGSPPAGTRYPGDTPTISCRVPRLTVFTIEQVWRRTNCQRSKDPEMNPIISTNKDRYLIALIVSVLTEVGLNQETPAFYRSITMITAGHLQAFVEHGMG